MAAKPPISILIPVLNERVTLAACLASVRRQTRQDWECVIVDDGSTDGSLELARRLARDDERIRVVAEPHRGLVAALNTGLEACRGEWVARMDADDVMRRDRLELQIAALEARPGLAAVGSHVRLFPRRDLGQGYREYEAWLNEIDTPQAVRREAFVECPVGHPTLMFRRRSLGSLRYRDMGWPEDYDLVLRMLARGDEIGVVPQRLVSWRHAPGRLSRNDPVYEIDRFTACKAHFLAELFLAGSSDYILWGHGGTGRALRRALAALDKHPTHVVEVHPGRLGNVIHGAPVVPPEALTGLPRHPLVVSVAGRGPRGEVRARLAAMGRTDPRDFICAA